MKSTTKLLGALAGAAILSTAAAASDDFTFLPVFNDPNWKPHVEVAAVGGYMDFDNAHAGDGGTVGLELSFDCPVFTLPGDNLIRQQLSVNGYDDDGLTVTTIEMNPYYFVGLAEDLVLGFGPGISAIYADPDHGSDAWLFGVQMGAGVKYYLGSFLVGADLRYQWTTEDDFGAGQNEDLDNWRSLVKVGYRF